MPHESTPVLTARQHGKLYARNHAPWGTMAHARNRNSGQNLFQGPFQTSEKASLPYWRNPVHRESWKQTGTGASLARVKEYRKPMPDQTGFRARAAAVDRLAMRGQIRTNAVS